MLQAAFVEEGLVLDELQVMAEEEKASEVRPLDERPAAARAEEDADVELAALCVEGGSNNSNCKCCSKLLRSSF